MIDAVFFLKGTIKDTFYLIRLREIYESVVHDIMKANMFHQVGRSRIVINYEKSFFTFTLLMEARRNDSDTSGPRGDGDSCQSQD